MGTLLMWFQGDTFNVVQQPAQDQHEQVNMFSTAQFEACRSGYPQLQTVEDEI